MSVLMNSVQWKMTVIARSVTWSDYSKCPEDN